jgi:hypothetical protein
MNIFLRFVAFSVFSIYITLQLSHASESLQITDPDEKWWSELRAQKNINEIYELRHKPESSLSEEQKNYILYACVLEGHPFANLEIAEQIFIPYLRSTGSFNIEFVQTDCKGILPPVIHYSNPITTSTPTNPTLEELSVAKKHVKTGLKGLLNSLNNEYDVTRICGLGICGLHPYQPFANKLSLTQAERQELFHYWNNQYKIAKNLSKYEEETDELLKLSDPYPTTRFWIQGLYQNIEDMELYLLLNQLLIKLDGIPETDFAKGLPWWRDPKWVCGESKIH